jgi:hypothetical protein
VEKKRVIKTSILGLLTSENMEKLRRILIKVSAIKRKEKQEVFRERGSLLNFGSLVKI